MKNGQRHLTERIELPNQSKVSMLGEKEIYKYLGILETEIWNKWRWKKKN